jgi:hypothetical protein
MIQMKSIIFIFLTISLIFFIVPIVAITSFVWNPNGITAAGRTGINGNASYLLNSPNGVAVDSFNAVFISDQFNSRIQKWLPNATNGTTVAGHVDGTIGTDNASLHSPYGVLVDQQDNIYAVDTSNHRVQFWLNGSTAGTTVAGSSKELISYKNQIKYCVLDC